MRLWEALLGEAAWQTRCSTFEKCSSQKGGSSPLMRVKIWVLEAGASGSLTGQRTHQIKITLYPKRPDGLPERIGTPAEDFQ
jgi:hypothetical protein